LSKISHITSLETAYLNLRKIARLLKLKQIYKFKIINPIMENKTWFVYILECRDGSYYTGVTNDLEKRMKTHALGKGSKYVSKKGFRQLLYSKPCLDKSDACKCEYAIKQLPRNEKLNWFNNAQ
jgi:putative endonuclease